MVGLAYVAGFMRASNIVWDVGREANPKPSLRRRDLVT
jgi:hypothetical protein